MPIRIGHMEIALAPGSVSRLLRTKSLCAKVRPEYVHISHVEDQPPPVSHRITLFQVENGRLRILRAQRRKTRPFPAVDKLHAQNITVKLHSGPHVPDPNVTAEIFSIVGT